MKQLHFRITGMHCTSCAINIDGEIEELKGVSESRTNYIQQTTCVAIDSEELKHTAILAVIKSLGYEAELVLS